MERRQAIVEDLLGHKASPTTTALVSFVVGSGRGRDLPAIIAKLVERAAAEKDKALAEVRSAIPLTADQQDRLAAALANATGKQVEVKVIVDPSVLGGLVATVDDTVIDGTVPPAWTKSRLSSDGLAPRRWRFPRRAWPHGRTPSGVSMAELTISIADIKSALKKHLEGFEPSLEARTVGRVTMVGDGIARVAGLPECGVNELLEFEDGTVGLALNLDDDSIGAVVLGEAEGIEEGQTVKSTGRILSVPVGDAMLGRVVNGLGEAIDGKGPIAGAIIRRVEIQAPSIMGRQPVSEPMQTGIKAIDAMTPIGRGQRELIIGDRKTGKTTVAIDTILNQKGQGVKCIYVAIGQKHSTVAQTVETLRAVRRPRVHGGRDRAGVGPGAVQVPRPLHRLRHGPAVDGRR